MIFKNSPMKKKTSVKLLIDERFKRVWKCQWRKSWRMAATRRVLTCCPLYDWCTHYQCCFRIKRWIKNGEDETGGGMLNYMCQIGVQHSHITTMKGAVIRRSLHKQTNLSNTNPWNRPGTWVIKQFVACYKNTKENILDYQWFSIRHIL